MCVYVCFSHSLYVPSHVHIIYVCTNGLYLYIYNGGIEIVDYTIYIYVQQNNKHSSLQT